MEPVQYLGGRYRLIEPLGAGGMSVVWRAYDEVLGRRVAVKLLAPKLAADPRSRDRIRDEARAAARLSHPHITPVHDYGESGGVPYVVMELVEGHPLSEHEALPWRDAVRIAADVASALAAAHARGLVHRDVKPANVMLTGDGAKLVDFGISAIAGDLADHEPTRLLGTPAYLAPERLSGAPTAPATDVYALGILLYRMLSGRHPWDADTPAMMLSAHKHRPPKPLPDVKGLPRSVVLVSRRCLAKAPADRPSADEVARELQKALGAKSRKALIRAGGVLAGATAAVLAFFTSCAGGHAPQPTAAQAAMAGAPIQCRVQYTTTAQPGGAFDAELAVTNAGPGTASDWQLKFRVTGGQVLHAPASTSLHQEGPDVVMTDPARPRLDPGGATHLALSGRYTSTNPLPTDFRLNGAACESVLLVNPPKAQPPVTKAQPPVKKAPAKPEDGDHGKGKKRGKD